MISLSYIHGRTEYSSPPDRERCLSRIHCPIINLNTLHILQTETITRCISNDILIVYPWPNRIFKPTRSEKVPLQNSLPNNQLEHLAHSANENYHPLYFQ